MHIPEQIIKDLPIIIPIVAVIIFVLLSRGLMSKFNESSKLSEDIDRRISDFKNKTFSSYEEESRAKKILREALLLEIKTKVPSMYRKIFENKVNIL